MEDSRINFFIVPILINILPYYGVMWEWRTLMVKLWSKTNEIWKQKENNFERIGKKFKRKVFASTVDGLIEKLKEGSESTFHTNSNDDILQILLKEYLTVH